MAHVQRFAESDARSVVDVVAVDRIVLMPLRLRITCEQGLQLRGECWRGHRFGEDAQAGSLFLREAVPLTLERRAKRLPRTDLAPVGHRLRAIGIPEIEHASLGENVRAAEARRMQRIALDLRRAAHVAFDQYAEREAPEGHCRRVKARFSGNAS